MLSKKQQKKLKQLQKAKGQEEKLEHKVEEKNPEQSSDNDEQEEQALEENNNGDIDFNQIQQVENEEEKIDVTFLIAEIREEYYHSMKTVLLRYGQVIGVTESEVAGEVLEKGNLGNVVVAEDEDNEEEEDEGEEKEEEDDEEEEEQNDELNVYSVVTILPSQNKITTKIIKQALTSLERHKQEIESKTFNKCQEILKNQKSCSLLLSARLPNLPSFIVCDSHEVFVSDLEELKKSQPKNAIFSTEYLVNVSEVEITNSMTQNLDDLIFSKFEDYEFCQKSLCWWVGENVKSQREKADLRKLYFVIKMKDYFTAVKNIKNYLEEGVQ